MIDYYVYIPFIDSDVSIRELINLNNYSNPKLRYLLGVEFNEEIEPDEEHIETVYNDVDSLYQNIFIYDKMPYTRYIY